MGIGLLQPHQAKQLFEEDLAGKQSCEKSCPVRVCQPGQQLSEAERVVGGGDDIEEERTQEMKGRLLRVDLRIRVVACSTARGAHRLSQTMS